MCAAGEDGLHWSHHRPALPQTPHRKERRQQWVFCWSILLTECFSDCLSFFTHHITSSVFRPCVRLWVQNFRHNQNVSRRTSCPCISCKAHVVTLLGRTFIFQTAVIKCEGLEREPQKACWLPVFKAWTGKMDYDDGGVWRLSLNRLFLFPKTQTYMLFITTFQANRGIVTVFYVFICIYLSNNN